MEMEDDIKNQNLKSAYPWKQNIDIGEFYEKWLHRS